MKHSASPRPHGLRAFTLVEILIAVTLFGVAISSTLGFYLYAMRTYQFDIGKCLVNSDFRRFTDQMVNNVTFASQIYILPSFTERTITTTYTDPITFATSTVTNLNTVANSTSGDFLVLVYQDATTTNIVRLVGYYRAEDSSIKNYGANQFPVRMFDIALDQPCHPPPEHEHPEQLRAPPAFPRLHRIGKPQRHDQRPGHLHQHQRWPHRHRERRALQSR